MDSDKGRCDARRCYQHGKQGCKEIQVQGGAEFCDKKGQSAASCYEDGLPEGEVNTTQRQEMCL